MDEELQRYLDGEADPGEAREVERRMADSPDEQIRADGLRQVGEAVRARYQAAVDEAEPALDALWGKIARQLDAPARPGLLARLRAWLDARKEVLVAGTLCAAAGAIIAVWVMPSPNQPVKEIRVVVASTPAAVIEGGHVETANVALPARTAEVESLEVTGGTSTVIQIPGDSDQAATTVIWVTHEAPAGGEGPI
jgi:anti-sigma factor RsiW